MADELTALDAAKGLAGTLIAMFGFHYKSLWGRVSSLEARQAKTDLAIAKLPTKEDHEKSIKELKDYITLTLREDPAFHRRKFRDMKQGFVGEFDED